MALLKKGRKPAARREPRQRRARLTVDAVLDSVARLLERGGAEAVTTNRIAATAGVSIGSVYQYFPNKQAIYGALLERHLDRIERVVEEALVGGPQAPIERRARALVEAMVHVHADEPELHALLFAQAPPHPTEAKRRHDARLRKAYRHALASSAGRAKTPGEVERMAFVLAHMVEALSHGAALDRPPGLSLAAACDEAVRAVVSYVRS